MSDDSAVTLTWEGREWTVNTETISVQQGIAMFLAWGFTLESWEEALAATDPRAMQCLYWLMLQQNGVIKPLKDCDFDMLAYFTAYYEALEAKKAAEAEAAEPEPEPGPTPPGGPPSPEPPSPQATTRKPRPRKAVSTASSPAP
jgi:hypothetical protein